MNVRPAGAEDAAREEKPPNEGVMLFPLVRPPKPLKPPVFPNPENAVGVELALAADVVRENPLNPLKAPVPSPSDPVFLRLAFLIARFFNTSSLATENVPA